MHKYRITIGVVCLGRFTYDVEAAAKIYKAAQEDLANIKNVDWVVASDIIISQEDARKTAEKMTAANVDAVAIISGTFHLGHLALIIDRIVKKPVLLWAFNELPYNGGKIRLNSVCGLNLNASNLYKSGNDTFQCCISDVIDRDWVDAIRMKSQLENCHIGLAGFRADGFFNLGVNELQNYSESGVLLDHYELNDLFAAAVTDEEVDDYERIVRLLFNTDSVTNRQVYLVAKLCKLVDKFLDDNKIDALAIRCWPEFAATYGIAPCAMMSVLQSMGRILACEGDIEAAMTMLATAAIAIEPPFLADLSQVNFEENYALMWHCGVAPADLWDGISVRSLDTYFAAGKGVTAGFVLKDGPVCFIRIDSARGKIRVFISKGTAVTMEKQLTGTYAKVRFNCNIRDLLDTVTSTGLAHHVVMVYGEHIRVFKMFAKIMQWDIIEV